MLRFFVLILFFTIAAVSCHARTTPRSLLLVQQQQQEQQQQRRRQGQEEEYVDNEDGKHIPAIATPNCSAFIATRDYLNRNDIPLPCRQKEGDDDDSSSEASTSVNDSPPQYAPPEPPLEEDGDVGSGGSAGGNDATSSPLGPDNNEADGNRVRVTLFVGIRPFIPNIEPIVTAVVTKWLNSTIQNMDFFLYDPFVTRRQRQRSLRQSPPRRIQDDGLLGIEGESGSVGGGGELLDNNPSSTTIYPQQQDNDGSSSIPTHNASFFTLIHFDTESDLVVKTNRRWYWKHTVAYECLYRDDRSPVWDLTLLRYVTENVTQALLEDDDADDNDEDNNGLTWTLRQRTGDEGVTITIKPEELPSTSSSDSTETIGTSSVPGSDENESTSREPSLPPPTDDELGTNSVVSGGDDNASSDGVTYTTPLDSQYWDWRRYLGLSLFLGTIVGTFVLSQIHAHRQRRLIKSQVWGNLASEEGINELLKTGWKVQGTSNNKKVLEIYDKSKWGYRENDSMLIGGFEQREAVVGAEITLTHAPSETNTQANISISQETHHTPPSPQPPYNTVVAATTPTGSFAYTTPVHHTTHQYGSPPTSPPRGGGGGPSTARTTKNNGSPPLSRSRF